MLNHTIETDYLSLQDKLNAEIIAARMLTKHGYWMSMYHCMTMMIHCKSGRHWKGWTEDDMRMTQFWWRVRNVIYKSK